MVPQGTALVVRIPLISSSLSIQQHDVHASARFLLIVMMFLGTTPWGTFVSCEEYSKGQCWQVDPDPASEHHDTPMKTKLGGQGGNYESVACDDRNPSHPIFFVTEDDQTGVLRRYTPPPPMEPGAAADWDALHADGGNTEFLVFLDDTRFTWSCDETLGRFSQEKYYPNLEGIDYEEGMLYFVSKRFLKLYVLDLDNGTYETSATNEHSLYRGEFKHQPDQLVRNREDNDLLYFTEDGGQTPGVYAIDAKGQSYAIFEAYDEKYFNDETTGLEFSPDGTTSERKRAVPLPYLSTVFICSMYLIIRFPFRSPPSSVRLLSGLRL